MSETNNHKDLKWAAMEWLYLHKGCKMVAQELKIGRYIYDVVGTDGKRVYIIEAKQDENDYLRDCNHPGEIKTKIQEYKQLIEETGESKKYLDLIKKEKEKSIKFFDPALIRTSTHRYIIAPEGLIEKYPLEWGVMTPQFGILKPCTPSRIDHKFVEKMTQKISIKLSKYYLAQNGVEFKRRITFPRRDFDEV